MSYTTILHAVRKQFGISCNEYCVADMVRGLSGNPESTVPGWCNASRGYLAEELDLSRQSVITIIKSLTEKGLVEENEAKHLRATAIFYQAVTGCKESLHPVKKLDTLSRNLTPAPTEDVKKVDTPCQETLQDGCKETLQGGVKKLDTIIIEDNNKEDNTTDNATIDANAPIEQAAKTLDSVESVSPSADAAQTPPVAQPPRGSPEVLRELCLAYHRENPDLYSAEMYKAFLAYWTATVQTGTKKEIGRELWTTQRTWNLAGRLSTWHQNNLKHDQRDKPNGPKSAPFLNRQRDAEPAKNGYGKL